VNAAFLRGNLFLFEFVFSENNLLPGSPAAKSKEPIEQAWPTHQVAIGGFTYCIVS
jgi:hypothetical protein